MKRIAALTAALMGAAALMVLPASPASAHTDACAGTGVATVGGAGLRYELPGNSAAVNLSFSFSLIGACAAKASLTATGTVNGWCGNSFGAGVTSNGHRFGFVGTGTVLEIGGEVVGRVQATPDVTSNQSCVAGATRFLVQGAAALHH